MAKDRQSPSDAVSFETTIKVQREEKILWYRITTHEYRMEAVDPYRW